jgi:glucose-1-phosphate adenylyltransferase
MKDTCAVILAGGKGTRLDPLTRDRAKPAVPIAGSSRLIDFPISEAAGALVPNILVLTQFESYSLQSHIDDHFRPNVGYFQDIRVQPPRQKWGEQEWYKGTADAINHNWDLITRGDPSRIIVLSGDHLYNGFSLDEFLEFHDSKGGDLTIAANRKPITPDIFEPNNEGKMVYPFGVIVADEKSGRIRDFQEKPEEPVSDLASMGVYIFNTEALGNWLHSGTDFGKDVIKAMHEEKRPIYTYEFDGYWEDVGSLNAYFNANMAFTQDNPPIDLNQLSKSRRTAIRGSSLRPASRIPMNGAYSLVPEGCEIHQDATVRRCVLSPGTVIGPNADLEDCIILGASTTYDNGFCYVDDCTLKRTIIDRGNRLRNVQINGGLDVKGLPAEDRGTKYTMDKNANLTVIARKAYS